MTSHLSPPHPSNSLCFGPPNPICSILWSRPHPHPLPTLLTLSILWNSRPSPPIPFSGTHSQSNPPLDPHLQPLKHCYVSPRPTIWSCMGWLFSRRATPWGGEGEGWGGWGMLSHPKHMKGDVRTIESFLAFCNAWVSERDSNGLGTVQACSAHLNLSCILAVY